MPLSDPYYATYQKIIQLLKAEPTLFDATPVNPDIAKVRTANFIDFTGTSPKTRFPGSTRELTGPGDFPAIIVEQGVVNDQGIVQSQRASFGTVQGFICGSRRKSTAIYPISVLVDDTRLNLLSALCWSVNIALSKGGSNLGLSAFGVWAWTPRFEHGTFERVIAGGRNMLGQGKVCRGCKISVTVNYNIQASTVTT